jgi:hypothetical protein
MPYKNTKHRTRRQRQQRRAGQVRRLEIVLSSDRADDLAIHQYLERLPRGEISAFIRTAILEAIDGQQGRAVLAELAALRPPAVVAELEVENQRLRERLTAAEQQIGQFEHQLQRIASNPRPTESANEPPAEARDQARQTALSLKLKKLSFAGI